LLTSRAEEDLMVMGDCCGPDDKKAADLADAISAIGKIVTTTTYEFDAEAAARAFAIGVSAIFGALGSRKDRNKGQPASLFGSSEPGVPRRPRAVKVPSPPGGPLDLSAFEDEHGRLKAEAVKTVLEKIIEDGPEGEGGSECYFRCCGLIDQFAPEKHRTQIKDELVLLLKAREMAAKQVKRGNQEKEPTITPPPSEPVVKAEASKVTPGGHTILAVQKLDAEDLKELGFPPARCEPCVEVTIAGPDGCPRAFRAKTEKEAIEKADMAMRTKIVAEDVGSAEDSVDYRGDLRDENPMSPKDV